MRKTATFALTGLLCASFATAVYASTNVTEVSAYMNKGIKFLLKGAEWTPVDAAGVKQDAITYEGSTYLPLRAVAEATGLQVNWDESTKTIAMTKKEASRSYDLLSMGNISPFRDSDISKALTTVQKPVTLFGKTYATGIQVALSPYTDYAPERENWLKNIEIELNGKYRKLEAVVGVDASSAADDHYSTVNFAAMFSPLNNYSIRPGDKPRTVYLDVTGLDKIYVSFSNGAYAPQTINLLDVKLYP